MSTVVPSGAWRSMDLNREIDPSDESESRVLWINYSDGRELGVLTHLIGGDFTNVNGVVRIGLARLHADGTLDDDFEPAIASGRRFSARNATPRLISASTEPGLRRSA